RRRSAYNAFYHSVQILRILLIEDQPQDAELMMGAVQRHGTVAAFTRAETIPALRAELDAQPEVILCAHNVSQVPLEAALRIVREHDPDLPFVIMSGPVVDEHTVSFLTSGASAMVRKDRL